MISDLNIYQSDFKNKLIKGKYLSNIARYFDYSGEERNVPPGVHSFISGHSSTFYLFSIL